MKTVMKKVDLKCANCDGTLKKVDDALYQCPYCDSSFFMMDAEDIKKRKKKEKDEEKREERRKREAKRREEEQKKREEEKGQRERKKAKKKSQIVYVYDEEKKSSVFKRWVPTLLAYGVIIALIVFVFVKAGGDEAVNTGFPSATPNRDETEEFENFCEGVFRKDYESISVTELESMTELYLSGYNGFINVKCRIGVEEITCTVNANIPQVLNFAYKFPNLTVLSASTNIDKAALNYCSNLTKLTCGNRMDDIAKFLPHPEKITHLSGVRYTEENEGLDKFSGLKSLEIENVEVTDLSGLKALSKLEHISIALERGSGVNNFEVFGEMDTLKSIYIDSADINSIEFVKNVEYLEAFGVTGSYELTSIKALEGREELRKLSIEGSWAVCDLEVINTLTGLESLNLYGNTQLYGLSWENLGNITDLKISTSGKFLCELWALPKLETLHVDCYDNLPEIGKLTNLKTLVIEDIDYPSLGELSGLSNLEVLELREVYAGENGEEIFNLPSIKEIYITRSTLEVDLEEIKGNPKLETLCIQYTGFNCENSSMGMDTLFQEKEYDLNDSIGFVEKFRNLKRLTVNGGRLENVDFVKKLPKLEVLDVSDNFIVNMDIVKECKNLHTLRIGDNALADAVELEGYVGIAW